MSAARPTAWGASDGSAQIGSTDHYNGAVWTGFTADYLDSLDVDTKFHTIKASLNYKF